MQQNGHEDEADDGHSDDPNIDPAIEWAFGPASRLFVVSDGKNEWLPVLLQLRQINAREFQSVVERNVARAEDEVIRIPAIYTAPPAGLEDSLYCTALVTQQFFVVLSEHGPIRESVARVTLGPTLNPEGCPRPALRQA